MQHDMFETKERVYLKSLQERKKQLKEELTYVGNEIKQVISRGRSYNLGGTTALCKHAAGEVMVYHTTDSGEVDFFSVVSFDLLAQAVERLKQEIQNAPKRVPGNHRSEATKPPW